MKIEVIILQGVPGSGKSTWIKNHHPEAFAAAFVSSADHYFIDGDGVYRFDPTKLGQAHAACMRSFIRNIEYVSRAYLHREEVTKLIVDNTSPRMSDLSPYYSVAKAFGAEVEIVRIACTNLPQAAERNTHGVPLHAIQRIAAALENPPPFWDCTFREVSS